MSERGSVWHSRMLEGKEFQILGDTIPMSKALQIIIMHTKCGKKIQMTRKTLKCVVLTIWFILSTVKLAVINHCFLYCHCCHYQINIVAAIQQPHLFAIILHFILHHT